MKFSLRNHVSQNEILLADKTSRQRRAIFAFVGTFGALGCSVGFVFLGYTGPLVERIADSLIGFAESMALLYMSAGVLDRSQLLAKIGDGFRYRHRRVETFPLDPPAPGE
jgi:hypothetical protein